MKKLIVLQRALGFLALFAFLVTGFVLSARSSSFPDQGVRMMYRSTHVYLLFASLLNLLSAAGPHTPATFPRLEGLGRGLLVLTPPGLLVAFFTEPPVYAIERPWTLWCVIAALVGTLLVFAARSLGPLRSLRDERGVRSARAGRQVALRAAAPADLPRLQEIRRLAFAPIFAGFRAALGDELYALAQADDERDQERLLVELTGEPWCLVVAERDGIVVGFASYRVDGEKGLGELGLNAVHPEHAGQGVGQRLYEHALGELQRRGMTAAMVATGGDAAHAPARRAYAKVGFERGIPAVWLYRLLDGGSAGRAGSSGSS